MKSSKHNKASVIDDISRETQRLISDSHVRLPYHKSKQKTLKDFLNRQKTISTECQPSITGSKKLLQKAWELIENKEKNAEQFYNEDSLGIEKSPSKNDDKDHNIIDEELNITLLSDNDENSSQETGLYCEKPQSEQVFIKQNNECLENNLNSNIFEIHTDCHNSIENKNESIADLAKQYVYELYDSSDYEENESSIINDEEEEEDQQEQVELHEEIQEEFFKKKKRKLIVLSESSDDETDSIIDTKFTSNDLEPLFNENEINISTQQLMGLCSGEFQTQLSQEKCSPEDSFDSVVPTDNTHTDVQNEDIANIPELISAKDFFEDEAELSESDWSSDDEEHLVDKIDNFEIEAGDEDKFDESAIKNGLDKIYMRQLLDDDQKQVTTLKEMLFEEGDLFSDSSRKRKFQWDEIDENDSAIGKPLFSDNDDDDNENDEIINTEQWRNDRFKRESYLSKNNKYANDYIEKIHPKTTDSNEISQASILTVKKTHIVKYRKERTKNSSNTDESVEFNNEPILENDKILQSTSISVISDTTSNKMNSLIHTPIPNKLVKGSFINRISKHKLNSTLLFLNKNPILINNVEKHEENINIKSMTTLAAKAKTNPFAYLLRNEDKQELPSSNLNNVEGKDNLNVNQSCIESTKWRPREKNISSILKQLK